jgi:hypothetical protein
MAGQVFALKDHGVKRFKTYYYVVFLTGSTTLLDKSGALRAARTVVAA